jgi:hypothetical protein
MILKLKINGFFALLTSLSVLRMTALVVKLELDFNLTKKKAVLSRFKKKLFHEKLFSKYHFSDFSFFRCFNSVEVNTTCQICTIENY